MKTIILFACQVKKKKNIKAKIQFEKFQAYSKQKIEWIKFYLVFVFITKYQYTYITLLLVMTSTF